MNEILRQILFLPQQRSTMAEPIDKLHYFVILVTMAGATLVTLVGAALLIRYRRRAGESPHVNVDAARKPPLLLEIASVVLLFTLFVVWWAIGTRQFIDLRVPPEDAMSVYVTAKQWMWTFAYPEGNSSIAVLYVPSGRPVKLIMTSRDMIHSFYVPEFRIKQDVIPGRYTTVWFQATKPGTYQILCAEYCGQGHSMMRGEVVALPSGDYERWLGGTDLTASLAGPLFIAPTSPGEDAPPEQLSLVRVGERVAAEQGCLRCHTLDGSPLIGPTWAGAFGAAVPLEGGDTALYDEGYITESMMDPEAKIHSGFNPVMPSYQGRISPPETAALIEFIKALRTTPPAGPAGPIFGPIQGPGGAATEGRTEAMIDDPISPQDQRVEAHGPDYLHEGGGVRGWLFTLDHKRIGLMFYFATLMMLLLGGVFALILRTELLTPDRTIIDATTYNQMFTLHGVVMVFLFMIPAIPNAFGNFVLPIMIGAKDLAFPRLNLLSFYTYCVGAVIVLGATLASGADTGWTFYPPYSTSSQFAIFPVALGIFTLGLSSIMSGVNFITTTHTLRAKGITWFRLPLFVWAIYATSVVQLFATPVLGLALILMGVEHVYHFGIFDPAMGGDPVLFQHLFWFYSHPAVYIMVLPAMGVISEVVCTFSHKQPASYAAIAVSSLGIAFVGFLSWGHHMFVAGMSELDAGIFGALSMFVGIFSAIKVYTWVATMYRGSIVFTTPMLYFFWFLFLFVFGGMTGVAVATQSLDVHWHDTYFVVAHFHFIMVGGTLTAYLAAAHYWFPKMFGRMYSERMGLLTSASVFTGFVLTFFPQFLLGNAGMPRRYFSYPARYQWLNVLSTGGAYLLAGALVLTLVNLLVALRYGRRAGPNPWGSRAYEWLTPTPPPKHNFVRPPIITRGPYDYQIEEEVHAEPVPRGAV